MSYKLACEAADVIAAVAPVDFDCVDGAGCSDCNPGRPITVAEPGSAVRPAAVSAAPC